MIEFHTAMPATSTGLRRPCSTTFKVVGSTDVTRAMRPKHATSCNSCTKQPRHGHLQRRVEHRSVAWHLPTPKRSGAPSGSAKSDALQ